MAGPLRVFISSTMLDVANERADVARKLRHFNFEPVNAEGLMPDGTGSWARIEAEIRTCDIFVLVLGESYGWIPDSGPKSEFGLSVTELEFEEARRQELPILVFIKRLSDRAPRDDRRDAFRKRVAAWDGGYFRAEFDLAHDLADSVGQAVVELISNTFRGRALEAHRAERAWALGESRLAASEVALPDELVRAVADGSAVLLLGAGASLQAGMPSAAAFVQAMVDRLRQLDPTYEPLASGTLSMLLLRTSRCRSAKISFGRSLAAWWSRPTSASPRRPTCSQPACSTRS